ncbi:MAG: DUF4418 family protein [Fusobacterium sp.]|nr:DUF4418 family protein [Fusobacterium sp.]
MKKRLFEILAMILAVVLYLVPKYIAPICTKLNSKGLPMGCFYSGNLVMKLAVFIFIVSLVMFLLVKYSWGKYIRILACLVNIVLAALIYMIPNRIISFTNEVGNAYGFCGNPMMQCLKNNTFGVSGMVGGILALVMIINLIYLFLKRDN